MEANLCYQYIRKWSNQYYSTYGDDQLVAKCDRWCQILNDEPEQLPQLLNNAEFKQVLAQAVELFKV